MGAGGEAGRREAGLNRPQASAALARFVAGSRWGDVPAAIRHEGRRGILNVLGCILAGRDDPAVELVRKTFPLEEALIDAAAATAHDYDDTHLPTVIHATPPVAAAVFSLARKYKTSGAELLHAFILGVETTCRMGNAVMPGHYEHGWHITSTCGVFGAAVAAARLLRLNEAQVVSALGIAATQAAGLVEVLGSMARVLNAGFAARNGIAAARLAREGFEGPLQPIEGRRGFMNVFGGNNDLARIVEGLGERWEMTQVAYKPYPSGVVLHALIDACLEHREKLRGSALNTRSPYASFMPTPDSRSSATRRRSTPGCAGCGSVSGCCPIPASTRWRRASARARRASKHLHRGRWTTRGSKRSSAASRARVRHSFLTRFAPWSGWRRWRCPD